ncbi:MAG: hypothetical protein QM613_06595 [Micrococcaceae bacterium]
MKLKADLYPYPVLSKELDDYVDSIFEINFETRITPGDELELKVNFTLENSDMQKLVDTGAAVFAVHLEGDASSFREFIKAESYKEQVTMTISSDKLGAGKLYLNGMVVANEDIENYHNSKFNADFYGMNFNIPTMQKGNILAFESTKVISLDFEDEDGPDASSMVVVVAKEQDCMNVDINSDVIEISLPRQEYVAYSNLSKNKPDDDSIVQLLMVTIVLPALMNVIEQLKYGYVDQELDWYGSLIDILDKLNITVDDLKEEDTLQVAQKLLNKPFRNVLNDFMNRDYKEESDE